jgi:FdhD protein
MTSPGKDNSYPILRCGREGCRTDVHELIGEEPLLIRIEGRPYSVVMRTPGEEIFHAAGFCLGEGVADAPDDFLSIGYCRDLDPNVIEVRLTPKRIEKVGALLDRRGFLSQTSCGICGKEMIQDLFQILTPVANGVTLSAAAIFECIRKLAENQNFYPRTRSSHAAMIVDRTLEAVAFAEDVGRHNALDKAIGKVLMQRRLGDAAILVLSSRISFELVQKAARARLPVVIGMSRPTALAVDMGRSLNMTLACADKESGLIFFCGEERILF